ncbi:DUF859 family phage minor structural protein [Streptococcus ictaluri]|uniref:Baseplate structural protein Gp10 C-terminal domain-containing protein n=1 Tax=Streptococcus ictaluri 707-05 TaxID=764299 RepID=G5K229_9STRE|nr:DUF859 family phage minor structural protein [Streptococcus ictaluri]EHI70268.1 hypothetical protein STRIC_2437 [Streptococcus ictaluri 707-05]QBX16586.1 capsid and scaffold protein [Streptococcus phage Javan261]
MSNSGSFNTNAYESRYLTFEWNVASQSIDRNQTTINWSLKGAGSNPGIWYMSGNFKVVIYGSTVYSSATRIQLQTGTRVASGTYTFTHSNDGSRSFSASAEAGIYYFAVNSRGSSSWSLPTIARATQPTTNKTTMAFGDSITINLPRASSNFTHTIQAGADDNGIAFQNIATGVGTSYTWTLPKSWANYLHSSSQKLRIRAYTYSGGTQIGVKEVSPSITVTATSDMKPVVSLMLTDENRFKDTYGGFVKGQSKIKAVVSERLYEKTRVASRSLVLNGVTYQTNSAVSEVIGNTSQVITASVTDTRGQTGTVSERPTVFDWYTPRIPTLKIYRCTPSGTTSETGTSVKVEYTLDIASVNNKNKKQFRIGYRKQTETQWHYKDISVTSYHQSGHTILPTDGENTWDIRLEVTDAFTTYTLEQKVGTVYVLMDFHKSGKGIALGKVAEYENCLDISPKWSVKIQGKTIEQIVKQVLLSAYPVGALYISTNPTNPASLLGGIWARFGQGRTLVGLDEHQGEFNVAEKQGGSKDLPLPQVGGFGIGNHHAYLDQGKLTNYGSTGRGWDKFAGNEIKPAVKKPNGYDKLQPYITVYMWKRTG